MARTTRLLSLLQLLRQRTRPVTAAALAEALGVSERTVYRDIAELAAQGAPITGEAGLGYVLGTGLFLPPLMLTPDETEAVVLGLRYVTQRGDATLSASAEAALAKMAAVLAPAAADALRRPISLPGPSTPLPAGAVDLDAVRTAIRRQARLRLTYVDAAGTETSRIVWPLAIAFLNSARIVAAFCELRDDYRSFRVDRIAALAQAGGRYPGNRAALLDGWRQQFAGADAGPIAPDRT